MAIQKMMSGNEDYGMALSQAQFQAIFETYLMPTFVVPTDDDVTCKPWTHDIDMDDLQVLSKSRNEWNANYLRRIRRDKSPCQSILLESEHGEIYFYLECDDMSDQHVKSVSFTAHLLRINHLMNVCDFRELKIRIDGDTSKVTNPYCAAIYYGGSNARRMASDYKILDSNGLVHHSIVKAVNCSLGAMRKGLIENWPKRCPVHSSLYMDIANTVRDTFPGSFEHMEAFYNIHNVAVPDNCLRFYSDMDPNEHPMLDMKDSMKYPLVCLTKREQDWVHKYSFPLMGVDHPYPNYIKAITECRFGNTFRTVNILSNKLEDDIHKELTVNFAHEDGLTRFMFREVIRPGIGVLGVLTYTDPSHIPFEPDYIKLSMITNKGVALPSDHSILDESVLLAGRAQLMTVLTIEILELLMVIHDRPEKYTTLKQYKPRKNHRKHDRSDEVIVHVLQSKARTQKQLADAKNRGEDVERNYVVPEWTRREHVRHYKNGKTVVIESTTCKRHKALAEAVEVKIKL